MIGGAGISSPSQAATLSPCWLWSRPRRSRASVRPAIAAAGEATVAMLPKLQRTYQAHSFEREKRAALEAWSEELDAILRGRRKARAEVLVMRRA